MAALLAEDEVLLLGFGNDEVELQLLSQHGGAEGEGMEGALRELQNTHTHTHTRNSSLMMVLQHSTSPPHTLIKLRHFKSI